MTIYLVSRCCKYRVFLLAPSKVTHLATDAPHFFPLKLEGPILERVFVKASSFLRYRLCCAKSSNIPPNYQAVSDTILIAPPCSRELWWNCASTSVVGEFLDRIAGVQAHLLWQFSRHRATTLGVDVTAWRHKLSAQPREAYICISSEGKYQYLPLPNVSNPLGIYAPS